MGYFSTKVRFEKLNERGQNVKRTELYWVDAWTFTEAEARVLKELEPYQYKELEAIAIKREKIDDILNGEGEKWYKVVTKVTTITAKLKEKVTKLATLVRADSTEEAQRIYIERNKGTMRDEKVEKVEETAIVDVIFYSLDKETEETR